VKHWVLKLRRNLSPADRAALPADAASAPGWIADISAALPKNRLPPEPWMPSFENHHHRRDFEEAFNATADPDSPS